ncbi:MAG: type VI secretion system-associated FHA domain protein [Steroidobacteraceae bacterium]
MRAVADGSSPFRGFAMALRLKIVSDNAASAGPHPRCTFGVNGGRIGRHDSNDWVLKDSERYVSGRHAEVEHRGGIWWLRDTSTNGTYVNDEEEALGPERLHQLAPGDRIRIGEYEIEVEISGGNDFPPREHLAVSEAEFDASFGSGAPVATGRLERAPRQPPPATPPAPPAAQPARVERAKPRVPPPAAAAPAASGRAREEQELWPGIVALCKGAGIDPLTLPADLRMGSLQHAGQLLRETLVGFTELARTRADFASEFGISSGARRRDATSPLVQIAAVEQILEMMLAGRGPGGTRAIDEMRREFARARHHEVAVAAALREALATVIGKLDPDVLEEQLGRRAAGAGDPNLQARLWNRYRDLFRSTVQSGDSGLPAVFLVAFARAYESVTAGGSTRDPGERDD